MGSEVLAVGGFGFSGVTDEFEGAVRFLLTEDADADSLLLGLVNPTFGGEGSTRSGSRSPWAESSRSRSPSPTSRPL